MTLNDMAVGQSAVVTAVAGDDALAIRLMEMGILEGETIELLGRAPLGDPLEFLVQGYRVSLRGREAARVSIAGE